MGRLFPYKEMRLNRIGYSTKSSTSDRRSRYPANLLRLVTRYTLPRFSSLPSKQVVANRVVIKKHATGISVELWEKGGSI